MANLYSPAINNEQLLAQVGLRHKRINLNYEYSSGFNYQDVSVFNGINWTTVDFNRANISSLNQVSGIYMYTFRPHNFSHLGFNSDVVLYIGQATNLRTRLMTYFHYPNSVKASDQERRFMILFFGDFLQLNYYETPHLNQQQLDILEHDLIDSILPPYNLKVYSQAAQGYRRIYQNN